MQKFSLQINGKAANIEVKIARTFFEKLIGFMFSDKGDAGLFIPHCSSIHTFFMKFNIDAAFVDKNNRIVKIISNIKPWKIILPVKNATGVYELPVGLFDVQKHKIGDILTLI